MPHRPVTHKPKRHALGQEQKPKIVPVLIAIGYQPWPAFSHDGTWRYSGDGQWRRIPVVPN